MRWKLASRGQKKSQKRASQDSRNKQAGSRSLEVNGRREIKQKLESEAQLRKGFLRM